MAKKPCDCDSGKMTFEQWAAAGGAVPLSFKGREKSWANQVKKYAAGGSVSPAAQIDGDEFVEAAKAYGLGTDNDTLNKIVARVNRGESVREAARAVAQSRSSGEAKMQAGGIAKLAKSAIGKASGSAGMKAPVVAEKDLTTLQDFHTSLGDRVRAGAEEARKMMEGFDYKYDKGQRVFTKDSAAKNRPPYTIIERTRVGNVPMRENMDDLLSKKVIDPETGRAKRTPYEPGYRVRMEHGPEDTWHEFVIPASAIIGDVGMKSGGAVHMQAGGIAKLAKLLKGTQEVLPAAQREANLQKMLSESKVQQRLYHGTKSSDDYADQPNQAFEQFTGRPTWLAQEPYTAAGYSGGTGSTYPVFTQLKKPLNLRFDANDDANKAFAAAKRLGVDVEHIRRMEKPEKAWQVINHPAFIDAVERAGYDGLAINEGGYKTFGVLDPRKIKSAIGNRGTYDTTNPDLNKAKGGEVKMAEGGDPSKPYIGYRRAGRRPESQQDREASANIPVAVARGLVSGSLGMPGDIESLARLPYELITGKESKTILPTSEDIEKRLPLRGASQTPVGQMFTGASQLAGGAYTGPGSGARAVMAVPKAIKRAGQDFVQAAGQPAVNVIKPRGGKPPVARTKEEQEVIDKFGQKQEQEAARAKKVEKLAQESAAKSPEDQATKPAKSKGKRVKVDADFYRKMAEDKGEAEVLRSARAGEHLKPTPGGYVGAPRTVTSGQALGGMRRAMDKDFQDSVQAVRLADPDRLGTWYDRAKQGIAESAEPYQLPRTLEQHGVYSAGVSPESELGFALKHLNSRVAGEPAMAYRGAPMRNLDTAVAEDRPANMGFKIGEYANKNDPRIPNAGLFGVNDFRRAQGMGYTDPQGNPWKAGVSETMHPFMDAETALQVDRANKAGTGGRTDWAGPHIQEVPWVYGKAQDIHSRGKQGRFGGDELEGIKSALQEANNTARDYMYKHAASATHEAVPGASLGHVPQVLDMTPAQKLEYGRTGRWDMPAPEYALSDMGSVGAGNRDIIYGAAGYRQLPSREAEGLYVNRLGGVETNPMTIARPLMDYPTGGGGLMAPESRKMADTLEQFRAFVDAQEAGAYNLPNTMGSVKGKNSLVLDSRKQNPNKLQDPSAGVIPTSQQLADMNKVMENTGFGVSATNRGVTVFPFDPMMDAKEASKILKSKQKQLTAIYPSTAEKSLTTTGYVPGIGRRSPEGPLSTAPYSGEATGDLLTAFSELHPSVAMNISESEAIRAAIREKALRDSKLGGTRGDIQESRRFFSEADWPKAVEMIRKGASVPAALAALGYSASSMAGENP